MYYDAAQLSDTVKDMRLRKMSKVQLPHIAIEDNEMPPHPDTYMRQLPAQFPFTNIVIIRKKMVLELYDLQGADRYPSGTCRQPSGLHDQQRGSHLVG